MAYYFYLGKTLLPIPPQKLQVKINNQNSTLTLINDGEINVLKKAKLTDVEFEVLLPQTRYPFAVYKDGFKRASYFLQKLESLKVNEKPFQFMVVRTLPNGKMLFHTDLKVSLEDYKITEDVKNGFDVTVLISLKEYRDYGTKTCTIINESKLRVKSKRSDGNSPAPKSTAKKHTVVKGDCLWAISKLYYGNGSRYPDIYNTNKSTIDGRNKGTGNSKYTIYPGQVFTIPV